MQRHPGDGGWAADAGEGLFGAMAMVAALATPMLQGRRSHWGLTEEEEATPRPGDALVPTPRWSWTHAVEVDAPASDTWPWVIQIGQGRAGFYSYQALENLVGCEVVNADHVLPDAQEVHLGDPFRLHPDMPPLRVQVLVPGRAVVVGGRIDLATGGPAPDRETAPQGTPTTEPSRLFACSWAFLVEPLSDDRCRVVSRFRVTHPDDLGSRLAYGAGLLEPIGFVMDRRMLLGIKERVEAARPAGQDAPSSGTTLPNPIHDAL